jgi:hypothetical protein
MIPNTGRALMCFSSLPANRIPWVLSCSTAGARMPFFRPSHFGNHVTEDIDEKQCAVARHGRCT